MPGWQELPVEPRDTTTGCQPRGAPDVLCLSFHFPETGTNAVTGDVRHRLTGCPEYQVTSVKVRRL